MTRENRQGRRSLHVVHGYPHEARGGTENYTEWLTRALVEAGERPTVFTRSAAPERSGTLVEGVHDAVPVVRFVNHYDQRRPWVRNALLSRSAGAAFEHSLRRSRPHLVHVHHLSGHALSLMSMASRRRVKTVFQLQDWWLACARVNLLEAGRRPCDGPSARRCSRCFVLTNLPPARLWNPLLYALRESLAKRALRRADLVVAGSQTIVDWFDVRGWLPQDTDVRVIPYGVPPFIAEKGKTGEAGETDRCASAGQEDRSETFVFGLIGTVMAHKGPAVAARLVERLNERHGSNAVRLEIWGASTQSPELVAELRDRPGVDVCGPFEEADKEAVFSRFDAVIVPSVGAESFGIVGVEAQLRGIPVLASRAGALEETLSRHGGAGFFDVGNDAQMIQVAEELLSGKLPRATGRPKLWSRHVEEVMSLYDELLATG